jgi:hypothetical protein
LKKYLRNLVEEVKENQVKRSVMLAEEIHLLKKHDDDTDDDHAAKA